MISNEERLKAFQTENNIVTKGPLSVVVQFTRLVRDKSFPLDPNDFKTSQEGQVAGLGGGRLKKILKEHGITQLLSSEGGRTSRGSMGLMIKYVDFLNAWNQETTVDFDVVEEFWAEQIREYFRNQPFVLTADTSKTIGANLDELFEQARKRQKQNPGTQYKCFAESACATGRFGIFIKNFSGSAKLLPSKFQCCSDKRTSKFNLCTEQFT